MFLPNSWLVCTEIKHTVYWKLTLCTFTTGSVAAVETNNPKKRKKSGGRGGGRMTEAEEDARMLKAANSKLRVVRVERQPRCLAKPCQMHPYQLEGLNWLISTYGSSRRL